MFVLKRWVHEETHSNVSCIQNRIKIQSLPHKLVIDEGRLLLCRSVQSAISTINLLWQRHDSGESHANAPVIREEPIHEEIQLEKLTCQ